jgi:hypothetical protein
MVVASALLREVFQNHNTSGRIAKWAMELMGYDISCILRTTIKSQILTDFITEWTG